MHIDKAQSLLISLNIKVDFLPHPSFSDNFFFEGQLQISLVAQCCFILKLLLHSILAMP